jgi:ABC-2 type transport system permease protein
MKGRLQDYLEQWLGNRFLALVGKEVAQILHNRQLLVQLLVPPTVFLILFGLALNPTFENLKVGITDYSQSRYSREFVELFKQTDAFVISQYYGDRQAMLNDLAKGDLTVGITIPPEFDDDLVRQRPAQVQAVFDAVDANTASVASGYLSQLVSDYNVRRLNENLRQQGTGTIATTTANQQNSSANSSTNRVTSPQSLNSATGMTDPSDHRSHALDVTSTDSTGQSANRSSSTTSSRAPQSTTLSSPITQNHNPALQQNRVELQTSVFYNPGLEASWFIVPGTIGILMTVLGSQAAASLVVREKEAGTIEQLIMTPASSSQIIIAKILPLLVLLTFDAIVAVGIGRLVFHMPFRGSFFLFINISVLYFFVGISIGIMIATYAKSEQQAQLTAFFINPPLVLLSGANSPIAAMPTFFQWLTYLDPMRYYIEVCRGILLKGVGLGALWHQVLILLVFATVLTTLGIRQFRNQLS